MTRNDLFTRADLEATLDLARVGMWSWAPGDAEVRWSALMAEYVGIATGSYEDTRAAYLDAIHLEDQPRVRALLQPACSPEALLSISDPRARRAALAGESVRSAVRPRGQDGASWAPSSTSPRAN